MIEFILFILIVIVGAHSYETRRRLLNVGLLSDQANAVIQTAIEDDRQRIGKLEEDKTTKK